MEIYSSGPPDVNAQSTQLPAAGRVDAPHTLAEQFRGLLNGASALAQGNNTALTPRSGQAANPISGSIFTETVLSVAQADHAAKGFSHALKQGIHNAGQLETGEQSPAQAFVQLQSVMPFEFVGLNIVANKGNDIAEEVSSLTRGR